MAINLLQWREQQLSVKKRYYFILYLCWFFLVLLIGGWMHFKLAQQLHFQVVRNQYIKDKMAYFIRNNEPLLKPISPHYQKLLHWQIMARRVHIENAAIFLMLTKLTKIMPNDAHLVQFKKKDKKIILSGEILQAEHLSFFMNQLENDLMLQQVVLSSVHENREKNIAEFIVESMLPVSIE